MDESTGIRGIAVRGVVGMVSTVTGISVSTMGTIEVWLRIISLLVGILVGLATLISILISISRKTRRENYEEID